MLKMLSVIRSERLSESQNVFKDIQEIEGFNTFKASELIAISKGMDKTDYRKYDIEEITKEVIQHKKLYPSWILHSVLNAGQCVLMPTRTFYKYTYKSPQGDLMTCGGIQ